MDYEIIVKKGIDKIKEGFVKIDGKIQNPSFLERYLIAATLKAIDLTNVIIFLCKNNFTNDSLIILRSLIEHSINMRWITNKNTEQRLKEYLSDLDKMQFGTLWCQPNLYARMEDIGFKNRDYYDFVVKLTYAHAHVNASVLKWGMVINDSRLKGDTFSNNAIYSIVAQMLGHVLKSLDTHFPGAFDYYNDIWKSIEVDYQNNTRKRLKEMVDRIKTKS